MKNALFLCLLLPLLTYAQSSDPEARTSFGIGGGFGVRSLGTRPNVQNIGGTFLNYAGKPQPSWGGQYYSMDEQGEIKEVQFGEFNADGYVRFGLFNTTGDGWLFNTNYAFSRYSYAYDNTPFLFKGYTLSRRNSDIESHAIQVGIARFWHEGYFVRMGGLYFYQFTTGAFNKPVNESYRLNFTENGTGFLVSMADVDPNKFALSPEIGFTSSVHPVEITLSATIPFSKYVFAERYAYYKNRQLVGGAIATYSEFAINFTVRLGLTLFKTRHRVRPAPPYTPPSTSRQRSTPEPPPIQPKRTQPTPSEPDPTPVHRPQHIDDNERFTNRPLNKPITLLVNFEQSKANLLPDSFTDLDALVTWMKASPTAVIRLEGHTDLIGDEQENLDLSRRRVVAVKDYLSRRGISSYRVETAYYGETRPLNRNCPPPTYCPENRRVEMVILKR